MEITNNKIVALNYSIKDEHGEIFDQCNDGSFAYLHGRTAILPGLEKGLTGKAKDEIFTLSVSPEEGYGLRDESYCQTVPRNTFPEGTAFEVGMELKMENDNSDTMILTITEFDDDFVTVDANHPLAGQSLTIDVKILDVREASQEELSHGHAHFPSGHDHNQA